MVEKRTNAKKAYMLKSRGTVIGLDVTNQSHSNFEQVQKLIGISR